MCKYFDIILANGANDKEISLESFRKIRQLSIIRNANYSTENSGILREPSNGTEMFGKKVSKFWVYLTRLSREISEFQTGIFLSNGRHPLYRLLQSVRLNTGQFLVLSLLFASLFLAVFATAVFLAGKENNSRQDSLGMAKVLRTCSERTQG